MEAAKISRTVLIISFTAVLFSEITAGYLLSAISCPKMVSIGLIRLLQIILIVTVVLKWGKGISTIGLGKAGLGPGFKKGILWSMFFGAFVLVISLIIYLTGTNPIGLINADLPANAGKLFQFLLVAGIIGPVAEEIFFRGILYGYFRQWGFLTALSISVIVFVMFHSFNGFPLTQLVGGIIFTIAYEKIKSLIAPMIIHILANFAIFTVSFISVL